MIESRLPAVAWPTVPLEEVAEVRTGLAKGSKKTENPVELPYLRVTNVQAGSLDLSEVKKIRLDKRFVDRYSLKVGDVLLTEGGDFDKLGRGTIWNGEIELCLHQNHVFAVRCDTSRLLPRWVAWLSGSEYGRRYFMLCSKQSTNLASINSSQLKAFPLPLPALADQRKMAAALSACEDVESAVVSLITAKRKLKHGLMQQLLTGQKRFPEFADEPWPSSRLGNHVQEIKRKNSGGTSLVLTASGEHGLVDQRKYFNKNVSGVNLENYHLVKRGEFAYNRSAMRGYPYDATKRLDEHPEGVLSTLYLCFAIADPQLDSDYLVQLFDSGILNRQLRPIVRVGGRAHGLLNVTSSEYLSIEIPFPSIEEQRRIANVLKLADEEIELLKSLKGQYENYKKGLLSRLLSGELELPAP